MAQIMVNRGEQTKSFKKQKLAYYGAQKADRGDSHNNAVLSTVGSGNHLFSNSMNSGPLANRLSDSVVIGDSTQ